MATEKTTKPREKAKSAAKPATKRTEPATAAAATNVQVDNRNPLQKRKVVVGLVVSNKMQKTIVVSVDRRVRHSMYEKYIVKSRKFKAHDEKNDAKPGDRVALVASKAISREKRWVLKEIIRRAGQTQDINV